VWTGVGHQDGGGRLGVPRRLGIGVQDAGCEAAVQQQRQLAGEPIRRRRAGAVGEVGDPRQHQPLVLHGAAVDVTAGLGLGGGVDERTPVVALAPVSDLRRVDAEELDDNAALGFMGNIIALMYLFLLGMFFLALAGLDAGSAFGGMGSSREVALAALAEPTVLIAIFGIALRAGTTSLDGIITRFAAEPLLMLNAGHLLAFFAFFIVALAENGRLPVDNPATHLELTMIHEAMILEYSGRLLALVEWAAAMKLFLFLTLLSNLFFPWGVALANTPIALVTAFVALAVKLLLFAGAIALVETWVAKLRLFRVPELLAGSFTLALLAVVTAFFIK